MTDTPVVTELDENEQILLNHVKLQGRKGVAVNELCMATVKGWKGQTGDPEVTYNQLAVLVHSGYLRRFNGRYFPA